jgi:hypothetical protein
MENNKRIMLSLVLVAVIAVAAIGIGYAYTASTTNTNNNIDVNYIELQQGGEAPYKFTEGNTAVIYWDSDDYLEDTTYYTVYTLAKYVDALAIDKDYIVVPVGKSFTISAKQGTGDVIAGGIDCKMTSENVKLPTIGGTNTVTGTVYIFIEIQDGTGGEKTYFRVSSDDQFDRYDSTNHTWMTDTTRNVFHIGVTSDNYNDQTVKVYAGYAADEGKVTISNDNNDPRPMPVTKPMDDAKLKFTVTVNANNSGTDGTAPTSISVTADGGATGVVVNNTLNLTATITDGTNKTIVWTSDSNKATVVSTGESTAVVTGVTATTGDERVTIKAISVVDNTILGSIELSVNAS